MTDTRAMTILRCGDSFGPQILEILNDAILNSTALYDYRPRTLEMMQAWFDAKRKGGFPVLGLATEAGELMGFASYGTFRAWPAYKYTVEHSVYVAARYRGQGVGRRLLEEVVRVAQEGQYHVLVGGIDSQNAVSIRLHRSLGFEHAGTIRHAGYKFGRWLDLDFYQRILETPRQPTEG